MAIHFHSAGGVILNKEGEIALTLHSNSQSWSFPKGGIEKGEDPLVAARREIYEETGIKELQLLKTFESYDRFSVNPDGSYDKERVKTMSMYLFHTDQIELKPIDKDNEDARWFSKEEAVKKLSHPKDKEFLLKAIEQM